MTAQHPHWSHCRLSALVDHILDRHHAFLRRELPRLEKFFENLRAKPLGLEELAEMEEVFSELKNELEGHMAKEEGVLFPFIRHLDRFHHGEAMRPSLPCTSLQHPINQMEFEHDQALHSLTALHRLSSNYTLSDPTCEMVRVLVEGLRALDADLRLHIALENDILFPRAVVLAAESYAEHPNQS